MRNSETAPSPRRNCGSRYETQTDWPSHQKRTRAAIVPPLAISRPLYLRIGLRIDLQVLFHNLQPVSKQRILHSVLNQISCEMSTAVTSDRVSVPALGVEGSKEIAVVTPDVIEVRRSFRSH
jgi:hypothetical protein